MTVRIEHADMLEAIPRLVAEGVLVDAVVTDPPYGLGFMGVAWDTIDGRTNGTARRVKDKWDSGAGAVFRPETWATVATIMRPGAFLVAFGGTRTHHRVWCAIEDAGFVIQDTIMWMFGTGFPKRRDMLKPAYEPVCLAYKPGGKRTMQIDECRIGAREAPVTVSTGIIVSDNVAMSGPNYGRQSTDEVTVGRWPANCCHDGSDEVLAAFPDSAGQQAYVGPEQGDKPSINVYGDFKARHPSPPRGDDGSAARFFWSSKAQKADRWGSHHPTVKPVDLIAWLVALVTPPGGTFLDPFAGSGTAGVAALKTGRNAILIEREDAYVADIRERMAHYAGEGRHSLASKARRAEDRPLGGLFAEPYDEVADARGSYDDAVRAVGERVKAGEPVPDFFRSEK